MMFLGLDLSLTGTGIALIDDAGNLVYTKTCKNKLRDAPRLDYIRQEVDEAICIGESLSPNLLTAIEGYAYGATGKAFEIGELGGVIKHLLYVRGGRQISQDPYLIVTPQAVKKWATGMGRGGKVPVGVALYKQFDLEFSDDNAADAYILAWIAKHYYTDIPEDMQTKYRDEVKHNLQVTNGTYVPKTASIPHGNERLKSRK